MNLYDIAVGILHAAFFNRLRALDDVRILETHFLARTETEEFLWSILHKVITLYPEFTREYYVVCAICLVFRIVDSSADILFSLREIGDDEFDRVDHSTDTDSTLVEVIAECRLEERHLVESIKLSITNLVDKCKNTLWTVTTAAETTDGRHTRIIPSVYYAFVDKDEEVSLREEDMCEIEFVELSV